MLSASCASWLSGRLGFALNLFGPAWFSLDDYNDGHDFDGDYGCEEYEEYDDDDDDDKDHHDDWPSLV